MNVLVVPTNRPHRLGEFLDAWRPWPWDRILIVEDAPESSGPDGDGERIHRYSWRDIDTSLPNPRIISRRDSAIRAFGFWRAWTMGASVIFTLDDDCFPLDREYVRQTCRIWRRRPSGTARCRTCGYGACRTQTPEGCGTSA